MSLAPIVRRATVLFMEATLAQRSNTRLAPATLEADRDTLLALQGLTDYQPRNPAFSVATLTGLETTLTRSEQEELRLRIAYEAARDRVQKAAQAFHDATLGAKTEVIAQYGADSDEVQAIGLKRKSDRRRPTRRAAASPATQ